MQADHSPLSLDDRWARFERLRDDLLAAAVGAGTLKTKLKARLAGARDALEPAARDRLDRMVDDAVAHHGSRVRRKRH